MKNILYIIPNKFWGGGQQYIYELSEQIASQKHASLHYIGRNVELLRKRFTLFGPYTSLPLKSVLDLYSIFKMGWYLRKNKIDIVHAHIPKDAILAVLAKKIFGAKSKVVMTRHLVRPGKFNRLYTWAYKQIDAYIFVSKSAENAFFQNSPKDLKINNIVIHNSIRGKRDSNQKVNLRETYNLSDSTKIIGFAGRIVEDKGPEVLIDAFTALQPLGDTVLILAGDIKSEYMEYLKNKIESHSLKDKVFFHPYVEDIYAYAKQIDIAVVPSIVKEACPLIIIEYMTMGKPIVTTNNGAQTELLDHNKEALLVPPADIKALASAMETLLSNPETCATFSENALLRAKEFTYESFYQKMMKIYDS